MLKAIAEKGYSVTASMPQNLPPSGFEFPGFADGYPDLVDLGSELRRLGMICMHGIALDDLGINSKLGPETPLEERFRIVIEDKPAVSTFVHPVEALRSTDPLWSTVGVVIGGGIIQAASRGDMSSIMSDGGRRRTIQQSPGEVRQELDQIAANDAYYRESRFALPHNEVVVAFPEVSGLYFVDTAGLMLHQINRKQVVAKDNTVPGIVCGLSIDLGLPVFAVRTTGVYRVGKFDPVTGVCDIAHIRLLRAADVVTAYTPGAGQ